MKFLLNENIPPSLVSRLISASFQSSHVRQCGLQGATDEQIIKYAIDNDFIIVTHDLDYGQLISLSGLNRSSAITFRQRVISTDLLFKSLTEAIPKVSHFFKNGVLVSIDDHLVRYRLLPFSRV